MNAPDCQELGRLVHRYGGKPVGSLNHMYDRNMYVDTSRQLRTYPNIAQALFVDCTHDNKPPVTARTALDVLPNAW